MPPIDLGDHLTEIAALVVLIAAAAFFSGSEAALISLSRLHARGMRERGLRGSEAVLRLLEDRNRFLTSILIGNTVVLLAAACLPLPGMRLRSHSTGSPSQPRSACSRRSR